MFITVTKLYQRLSRLSLHMHVGEPAIGLEVNADKTKYMIMSWDQNAGRSHSIKIHNSSTERVEEFKYLGTTLTNQNSIQEEITSIMKLGNACYSAQNLLSSRLIYKKLKNYNFVRCPAWVWNVVADNEGGT
jgi:hypothetical protein